MGDSFKGYFLGADAGLEKDKLLLCFRDTTTRELRFGFYENWHPREYIVTYDNLIHDLRAQIYHGIITQRKGKSHRIKFTEPPQISGRKYGKFPNDKALEVKLLDYRDRNCLCKAAREEFGKTLNAYPDGYIQRSYEEAFYEEEGNEMLWNHEYEVDVKGISEKTPNRNDIYHFTSIDATGNMNKNIGILAYDLETDVKRWVTTSNSYAAWVPKPNSDEGELIHKVFIYPPKTWRGSAEEFKAKFIDKIENEAVARDAKKWDLSEITVCSPDRREFLKAIGKDYADAVENWCDVISGYNTRSYDQSELNREIKKQNRLWREYWESYEQNLMIAGAMKEREFSRLNKMEIKWFGKGGYPARFRRVAADDTTLLSSPFTLNLDVYKVMQRGMGFPLPIMHRRLEDFEKLYGQYKERDSELEGLHIWKLHDNPELMPGVLIHNLNDVDSTLYFARKIVDRMMDGDMFTAMMISD